MENGQEENAAQDYSKFMSYLYKDCSRDEYSLLVKECESADIG